VPEDDDVAPDDSHNNHVDYADDGFGLGLEQSQEGDHRVTVTKDTVGFAGVGCEHGAPRKRQGMPGVYRG